ncbi:hypothetical protein N1851_022261 [Merluccius polli]|uniref:Uncharacterized protein n=1 Tax=Merluccius polli TaxID=89951 RepID=A0AA47MIG2_MERPO|nr:hypothetical protein N1851_022261 [Merluccius polli]
MKFKPKKSRSLVIRSGKVTNRFQLQIQGETIPSIEENPIKCLGNTEAVFPGLRSRQKSGCKR